MSALQDRAALAPALPLPASTASAASADQGTAPDEMNPRTRMLLHAPILPTLLRLAWPNLLVMLAMASVGLIETWWLSRLGTAALTGMAVVFPGYMLMTMLSAGAMGGGISSAIARALGARRQADADALVLHAVVVNGALGLLFGALAIGFGPRIYAFLGAEGASLRAALLYSDIVFGGAVLLWVGNALASVLRGGGNMALPAMGVLANVALLVPLSPLMIYGWGPVPGFGIAGAGYAVVIGSVVTVAIMTWALWSGRSVARFRPVRLRWAMFADILRVGAAASVNTLQTTLNVVVTTYLVAAAAGTEAVAGYGVGNRLEYLLVPMVFGFGAPLVAMVGTNIGAGQRERALRVAMIGAAVAFAATETIGLLAAIFPLGWLGLFGDDPAMLATGATYLRAMGPAYGFFGLGLALYFASQGAGRLLWPVLASAVRSTIVLAGGWIALRSGGSLRLVFLCGAAGMLVYGVGLGLLVRGGIWFRGR